ncbi:hypothetical protein ARMSODRAFT_1026574 [Armillaria solidipes]|uniref:Uncharacterized protein n=1 Tax=Armillaria solidipes TaxID=1076256 RepID=A0A2H3B963_9AGAR|nr:hypothetical protein ARMSODRAFT_1026574 [Armillaria solidipes]
MNGNDHTANAMPMDQPLTWRDFLDDPDPLLAALAREIRDTPAQVRAHRKYYSLHQEELQDKARTRAHTRWERNQNLSAGEQTILMERARASQARYRASKWQELADKEKLRREKKKHPELPDLTSTCFFPPPLHDHFDEFQ